MNVSHWETWTPREGTSPVFRSLKEQLLTEGNGNEAIFGYWRRVFSVSDERDHVVTVEYEVDGIPCEEESVAVILAWQTDAGDPLAVDYLTGCERVSESRRRLRRRIRTRSGAATVEVRLLLRFAPKGRVTWTDVDVEPLERGMGRRIRVGTTRISPGPEATIERNVRAMEEAIDNLAPDRPDLICLTENFVDRGVRGSIEETSQPIPGEVFTRLCARAAKHRTYVVTSMHEEDQGRYYNTAVLINRSGRLVGKYRKVHLTHEEQMRGITPGTEYPVFDTDFGRMGILICYDMWFLEPARILALNGAELIAFPLAGAGIPGHYDHMWPTRAMDNGVAIVSSSTGTSPSQVIDRTGQVLATTMGDPPTLCTELDLDVYFGKRGLSVGRAFGEATVLFQKERRPSTYDDLGLPEGGRSQRVLRDPDLDGTGVGGQTA